MKAKHAKVDVLSINYRLAPDSKYPSQLFEAFSAWVHLRQVGYDHIFLGGDSAGANIALTLWRYLHEVTNASHTICGLVLHSPWLDFESFQGEKFALRSKDCSLTSIYPETGLKAMQTNNKPSPRDPWLSPLYWSSETMRALPPMFVSNGGLGRFSHRTASWPHTSFYSPRLRLAQKLY
jgi:monoterpene epsilon-lactone hydrolase